MDMEPSPDLELHTAYNDGAVLSMMYMRIYEQRTLMNFFYLNVTGDSVNVFYCSFLTRLNY